jgi:hypothetical protein
MPGAEDIHDAIIENATGPRKHTEAEGMSSTEQHSLPDQIAAHKHIASTDAVNGSAFPIKRCKVAPPGGRNF